VSRFPVAFPLPAFASRSSDTRRGVGPSSRSAYRAAPAARPDPDGVTTFRTHELRLGWVPSLPRGRRCSSRPSRLLDRRLPLCRGQSLYPASTSHRRGLLYEHQRGFTQFTRPVFPSPAAARMERAAASAFPRASHPADQEPPTHVEVGTGQRARTWNYSLNITSVDPPIGSSLTTCDLASHDEQEQSGLRLPSCMELDSGSVTAALHGCRSAVGADCEPADAWSSSSAGVSGREAETLARRPNEESASDRCSAFASDGQPDAGAPVRSSASWSVTSRKMASQVWLSTPQSLPARTMTASAFGAT